ncbi:helix-turn-helix transcriptional regulator [Edwardsiella tarda]
MLDSILIWLQNNIMTGKGIGDLAIVTGYSRRTLELWFRDKYNLSPGEYLLRLRMSQAAVLLRMTSIPVTEIAELFSYSSSQNFSRAFKRSTGKSPSDYRSNQVWDCAPLQVSLLRDELVSTRVSICHLPNRYLHGDMFYCKDELLGGSEKIIPLIKGQVTQRLPTAQDGVYIAAKVADRDSILTELQSTLNVCIFSGELTTENNTDKLLLHQGRYLHYHYVGSWVKYGFVTKVLYTKYMATGKYKRRDEFDVIHFTSNDDEHIVCDIYIPIY